MNTYKEFARQNYQSFGFFTEEEFKTDLKVVSNINRMIIELVGGRVYNIKRITNLFICLSNVFNRSAIPELLRYKIEDYYHPIANSFLLFLNLPTISNEFEDSLYTELKREYSNENYIELEAHRLICKKYIR